MRVGALSGLKRNRIDAALGIAGALSISGGVKTTMQ
jgi:hypothetical protein